MKQSLQLKLGQNLALTPQLQQAIKLLQLSTLDLQQAIDEALEGNPLLEREEEHSDSETDAVGDNGELDFTQTKDNSPDGDDELAVDTRWEDLLPYSGPAGSADDENQIILKSYIA